MTMAPTRFPSLIPSTSIPSQAPSITGAVGIVELGKTVTESLSSEEIASIVMNVADAYGVDEEDVEVEIVYQTTGSMTVTIPDGVSLEELESSLEDEISELLGVHESSVQVTVSDDGSVTYTITSTTAEGAQEFQDAMAVEDVVESLNAGLSDLGVSVDTIEVDSEVTADIVVTADTTNASNNLNQASSSIVDTLSSEGYTATAESKFFLSKQTVLFEMYSLLLHPPIFRVSTQQFNL